MTKLLVIGNCQARPLSSIMASGGSFKPLDTIILHLSKDSERSAHQAAMDEADLILAQLTAPIFRPAHLTATTIKARHPEKTVIWPNLFYGGQQPFLRYLTHADYGRILGPLHGIV